MSALERGGLLADRLLFDEFRQADRLLALGLAGADFTELRGTGNLDRLLAIGVSDANFTELFLIGHVAASLLNRLRRRLLADGVDVAALVGDVGDVDVDQHEADFLEFRLDRVLNVFEERIAVAVDVLDPHRGDHLPQLAENDFPRLACGRPAR